MQFFIVSHRRSGTHLVMEMLANAFKGPMRIFKTNHIRADDYLGCECLLWMRKLGKIVHAQRDIRDVLVSVFHYRAMLPSFNVDHVRDTRYATFLLFLKADGAEIVRCIVV